MITKIERGNKNFPPGLAGKEGFLNQPPFNRIEPNSPNTLYINGIINPDASGAVTIGSRKITEKDVLTTQKFLRDFFKLFANTFKDKTLLVVSGACPGGDAVGHETAIGEGINTLSVLPTPANLPHPFDLGGNIYKLIRDNIKSGSSLMSEHQPVEEGTPFKPDYYGRNRLTAWMGDLVLVYGVYKTTSGAMHTASIASHANIPIFFINSTVNSRVAEELVNKYHAKSINSPEEILDFLTKRPE